MHFFTQVFHPFLFNLFKNYTIGCYPSLKGQSLQRKIKNNTYVLSGKHLAILTRSLLYYKTHFQDLLICVGMLSSSILSFVNEPHWLLSMYKKHLIKKFWKNLKRRFYYTTCIVVMFIYLTTLLCVIRILLGCKNISIHEHVSVLKMSASTWQ